MSKKFYTINVFSGNPSEVLEGTLNATTGQPQGKTTKVIMQLGEVNIPNNSNIWGIEKKDAKTGKRTGEITALPWGEKGGARIQIRYCKNSSSLSRKFQELEENIKELPQEDTEITLKVGLNEFDENESAELVQMLKWHTLNQDNESRDPSIVTTVFENYSGSIKIQKKTNAVIARRAAEDYIIAAKGIEDGFAVLAVMFGLNPSQDDDIIEDQLWEKLDEGADAFLEIIERKKNIAQSVLVEAVEAKVLHGEDQKEITIFEKGKMRPFILNKSVIQEGENTVDHIMAEIMNHEYYDVIKRIDQILQASRESVLN